MRTFCVVFTLLTSALQALLGLQGLCGMELIPKELGDQSSWLTMCGLFGGLAIGWSEGEV